MILDPIPNSIYSKKEVSICCDVCSVVYERRYDGVVIAFEKRGKHLCKKCSFESRGVDRKGIKRPKAVVEKFLATRAKNNSIKYPNFTIACKYCGVDFVVSYGQRDRLYCGRTCQSKAVKHSDIRETSICIVCKQEFKHYGERIVCSRECNAKYMSAARIGVNNPACKQKDKKICLACGVEFEHSRVGMHKKQERVFCSLACAHIIDLKKHSLSKTVNPYPQGWREAKKRIKQRDGFTCQLCGSLESLCVHHINYDKNDLEDVNLITLCQSCHNMTHQGRAFWEIIFSGLLSGSKLVSKPWGAEIHLANNNQYCLKYLIFFKGMQFSYHSHKLKKELWHCVYGKLECVLSMEEKMDYFIFNQGDKIELNPNVVHQLQAIKNSILVEVSSRDYPEDSYRVIEGIN